MSIIPFLLALLLILPRPYEGRGGRRKTMEILHWERRKTRKPHRCWGCGKTYPSGSEMIHAAYTDGGQAYGCYWCTTCEEYMRRYFEHGDDVGNGDIYANDPEGWEALRKEVEC